MPWQVVNGKPTKVEIHVGLTPPEVKPSLDVPDGPVSVVIEWAGDDPARRSAALEAEKSGKGRKTVIEALS